MPPLGLEQNRAVPEEQHSAHDVIDVYFSADVETDGPIPGPYSMLSFGLVLAGTFDGKSYCRPADFSQGFYREVHPISDQFQAEALRVNGLDRERLRAEGCAPDHAMNDAADWVRQHAGIGNAVLVAYPLSFDWVWLYWYFMRYATHGSPFSYSRCFDLKTAYAVKAAIPISGAGRSKLEAGLRPKKTHTHHALEDAAEQAEIFANVFQWKGPNG